METFNSTCENTSLLSFLSDADAEYQISLHSIGEESTSDLKKDYIDDPNSVNSQANIQNELEIDPVSAISTSVSELEDDQIVETSSDCSDVSREPVKNTLKRSGLQLIAEEVAAKKCKKSISFSAVTAYYFPRAQGFTCVPSVSVLDKHEVDTASHSKQSRQTR